MYFNLDKINYIQFNSYLCSILDSTLKRLGAIHNKCNTNRGRILPLWYTRAVGIVHQGVTHGEGVKICSKWHYIIYKQPRSFLFILAKNSPFYPTVSSHGELRSLFAEKTTLVLFRNLNLFRVFSLTGFSLGRDGFSSGRVVYFDQRLGAGHSKCWSKESFSVFLLQKT